MNYFIKFQIKIIKMRLLSFFESNFAIKFLNLMDNFVSIKLLLESFSLTLIIKKLLF